MKQYTHIVFDADHTLLNYLADERNAFLAVYQQLNIPITDELLALSRTSSENAWTDAGLYNVTDPVVQKQYHTLYRTHTEEIFRRIFAKFPCATTSAKQAGLLFLEKLTVQGVPYAGALELVRRLSRRCGGNYAVAIATNGLSKTQHARLSAFSPLVEKVFVSQDLQSVKPLSAYFESMLNELGATAENVLMVGDSLISDVTGAKSAGMDACWLNPLGQKDVEGIADYQIKNLEELLSIV